MKLVLCIDERGGMAFNGRRVSRDKLMIEDLSKYIGDGTLFIEPYSEELFSEESLNIVVSNRAFEFADKDDFVFVEKFDPIPFINEAEALILYKWNRRYPYDISFKLSPGELGFTLSEAKDFEGNSHEKITREIYVK